MRPSTLTNTCSHSREGCAWAVAYEAELCPSSLRPYRPVLWPSWAHIGRHAGRLGTGRDSARRRGSLLHSASTASIVSNSCWLCLLDILGSFPVLAASPVEICEGRRILDDGFLGTPAVAFRAFGKVTGFATRPTLCLRPGTYTKSTTGCSGA